MSKQKKKGETRHKKMKVEMSVFSIYFFKKYLNKKLKSNEQVRLLHVLYVDAYYKQYNKFIDT